MRGTNNRLVHPGQLDSERRLVPPIRAIGEIRIVKLSNGETQAMVGGEIVSGEVLKLLVTTYNLVVPIMLDQEHAEAKSNLVLPTPALSTKNLRN